MKQEDFTALKTLLDLAPRDAATLRCVSEHLMVVLPTMLNTFYRGLQAQEWVREFIHGDQAWRRHRDAIRGFVVTVVTQDDSELEDLAVRTGKVHANLGIHSSRIITSAASLCEAVTGALQSSPRWNQMLADIMARRWAYAVSIMIGAYEDTLREANSEHSVVLQQAYSAFESLRQRAQEATALARLLQQILEQLPESHPGRHEAMDISHRMEWLLA